MPNSALIFGAGPAGLSTALAISQATDISVKIHELWPTPATIGGSINLTPNALRLLEDLGVEVDPYGCRVDAISIFSLHTGQALGEMPFRKSGPALRIMREELTKCLLRAVEKRKIEVLYDSKLVAIKDVDSEDHVTAVFENGNEEEVDFILGCDGVHSAVRELYVEPARTPKYTEVVVSYSIVDSSGVDVHFAQTAINSGRCGSLFTTFVDTERKDIHLGYVFSMKEEHDKQGWKAVGKDRQKMQEEIDRRYKDLAIPCVDELVRKVDDFFFFPVYSLGPGGKWSRGKVLLLGDAAHNMPPSGESTGLAIEDGILLARVLSASPGKSMLEVFRMYERTRRPRIDAAYKEAVFRWAGVKDRSWLFQKVIEWMMWAILWWKIDSFESSLAYDIRKEPIIE